MEPKLQLPGQLVSTVDLGRIIHELAALDESLRQAALRNPNEPAVAKPSVTLNELANLNKLSLVDASHRAHLNEQLKSLDAHAPRIHMSLASEPSGRFVQQIIGWFRAQIHPTVLLDIGLQPTLGAGCMLRTDNKIFDMSLRNRFMEKRSLLVQKLGEETKA